MTVPDNPGSSRLTRLVVDIAADLFGQELDELAGRIRSAVQLVSVGADSSVKQADPDTPVKTFQVVYDEIAWRAAGGTGDPAEPVEEPEPYREVMRYVPDDNGGVYLFGQWFKAPEGVRLESRPIAGYPYQDSRMVFVHDGVVLAQLLQ